MASQSRWSSNMSSITGSSKIARAGQFMRLNPPIFMGSKVEEDPQRFVDEMVKIFRVMNASDTKGVEFLGLSGKRRGLSVV